ncbi:hypothetical protein GS399_09595 [Pedobacter sp. HMF7647]|uniref:Uncharacterized protein n=1 Tax=Hufsiella arboris TaxID=2695275 RepID=A0A7K1YA51_9SPHI|nr:hypothetical protein [Hufsiella arboris]MXV51221.1 hypothetical protein [Hufsiella arboris]
MEQEPYDKRKNNEFEPETEKRIWWIVLSLSCVYIYQFIVNEGLFQSVLTSLLQHKQHVLYHLIRYILPVPALILLFKRRRSGWFLTYIYLIVNITIQLFLLGREFSYQYNVTSLVSRLLSLLIVIGIELTSVAFIIHHSMLSFFRIKNKWWFNIAVSACIVTSISIIYSWYF